MKEASPSSRFAETRWTNVLAARGCSPAAGEALRELCATYYEPVLAFIKHSLADDLSARDHAHDFFAKLLANPRLERLERGQGKFRSYLLGAVKHFLADAADRIRAAKRGGGLSSVPLTPDTDSAAGLDPAAPAQNLDAIFDREWAVTLIGKALSALEAECVSDGRTQVFETLKPWLTGDVATSQAEAAEKLGLSEGAVKVAIHRLRKRYRELVKSGIAQTVNDPEEIAAELQHLVAVLS